MALPENYKLSDKQIQEVVDLLEIADRNHRDWLSRMHISIVCNQPFEKDVFAENSHECCMFGQWYYNNIPDLLKPRQEFIDLEPLHKKMHDAARHLAKINRDHKPIPVEDYQAFIEKQRSFSNALQTLRDRMCECLYSFDALTGLMTREPFAVILESEYARVERTGTSSCIVLMDVDYFKSINDDYGHLVGDRVLREVSQYIRSNIRPYDSVCRYGGEEFLIILPNTDLQEAFDIIDRLRVKISKHEMYCDENKQFFVTVSAGISKLSIVGERTSVGKADKALYQAKKQGRNCVCYSIDGEVKC